MTPAESLTRVLDILGDFPDAAVQARAAVVREESFGDVEGAVSRLLLDPLTAPATRDAFAVVFCVDGRLPPFSNDSVK